MLATVVETASDTQGHAMSKDRKKPGRKPGHRPRRPKGERNLNIWIKKAIGDQMDAFLAQAGEDFEPSITQFAEAAFKSFLRAKGFWPPKGEAG